jgi:hypothetical protein
MGRAIRLVVTLAPWTLGGMVVFAGVGFLWWMLLDPAPSDTTIVIEAGTAERIARGAEPLEIPDRIDIERGGRLKVENRDVAGHRLGDWLIMPGETLTIEDGDARGSLLCSFHPGGALNLASVARGGLLVTMLAPALILGLPIGLFTGGAVTIARRLDMSDAAAEG